jgi:Uma2 family endonuclease
MSTQPKPYITEEQYLEMERRAEQRSEYLNGEVFAMAGASLPYVVINDNLVFVFRRGLAGRACRAYSRDLRVLIAESGLYTYPDLLVICGAPQIAEKDRNTVTNPKIIVEVLSPATADYDRGEKFMSYRSIPSFREYLVIYQDRVRAEHYVKQTDEGWLFHDIVNAEAVITLESIGVSFKLSEAYDGVEFELRHPA